jgi:hypothetical protein
LPATPNRKPVSNSAESPAENSHHKGGSIEPGAGEGSSSPENFIGLFLSAGKPLNKRDLNLAASQWRALSPTDRISAFNAARDQLQRTADPQYIPLPANFLVSRAWERTAMPRQLPIKPKTKHIPPKTEAERIADIQRQYEENLRLNPSLRKFQGSD